VPGPGRARGGRGSLTRRGGGRMPGSVLSIGSRAPDFEGVDQAGKTVTLDELVRESAVVLYFYPKDFTPVCTAQACVFRDAHEELARQGVRVVGVSMDDTPTHARFAEKHGVAHRLLSDPDKRIQKAYEARQLLGMLPKRVTYVIDRQKTIRAAYHHELSAGKHLEAVKAVVASLGG
jgi:peroxiredoxin Q/BCP